MSTISKHLILDVDKFIVNHQGLFRFIGLLRSFARVNCTACAFSFPPRHYAPSSSTISRLTALAMASINYHGRKLVQRTLLILSRDNNYSLFLGRSGGNRFFSPLTGHFVDRARDPSFIRAETIILYVHWPQGGRYTCLVVI